MRSQPFYSHGYGRGYLGATRPMLPCVRLSLKITQSAKYTNNLGTWRVEVIFKSHTLISKLDCNTISISRERSVEIAEVGENVNMDGVLQNENEMICGVNYYDCNCKELPIYATFVVANTLISHSLYIPYFNKERVAQLYLNNGNGTFTFELPDVQFNESGVFNLYFFI